MKKIIIIGGTPYSDLDGVQKSAQHMLPQAIIVTYPEAVRKQHPAITSRQTLLQLKAADVQRRDIIIVTYSNTVLKTVLQFISDNGVRDAEVWQSDDEENVTKSHIHHDGVVDNWLDRAFDPKRCSLDR